MNLPASAPEFTDAFVGMGVAPDGSKLWPDAKLPLVHCYCFARGANESACRTEIATRLDKAMGGKSSLAAGQDQLLLHDVRDVAPNKRMFCATFRLPAAVAFAERISSATDLAPPQKKVRAV